MNDTEYKDPDLKKPRGSTWLLVITSDVIEESFTNYNEENTWVPQDVQYRVKNGFQREIYMGDTVYYTVHTWRFTTNMRTERLSLSLEKGKLRQNTRACANAQSCETQWNVMG